LDRAAAAKVSYADVRIVRQVSETVAVKNGVVSNIASHDSQGFGHGG